MTNFTAEPGSLGKLSWDKGQSGDGADIQRQVWSVEVKGGQAPMVRHGSEQVRAVRMVQDGRLGFAASRTKSWLELKQEALRSCANGPETKLDEPVIGSTAGSNIKSRWTSAMIPQMNGAALTLYHTLQNLSSDFRPSVTISFVQVTAQLTTSNGGQAVWTQGYWDVSAGGRRVNGTDFHGIAETRLKADDIPDINQLGLDLAQRFGWGQDLQTIDSGKYPIVFLPPVTMGLLTSVLARLSGPSLISGNSPWEDQRELQVLSPLLSIFSDATIPDGPRTSPFDDEGTSTGKWALIENGILKNFVLNRDAARHLGLEPQGMGYRPAPTAMPLSLPANLVIQPSASSFSELLNRFPRMLVLNGWIGGRPTNPLRGDIAGNASDLYFSEQGVITGRVKNAVISVNVFDALSHQLVDVGQDASWVAQGMMQAAPGKLPPLLIDHVDVTVRQ